MAENTEKKQGGGMKEIISMLVVLTLICTICGLGLAYVNNKTKGIIMENVLKGDILPAVKGVLAGSTNDLLKDRKEIKINNKDVLVFIGKKNGSTWGIAFETKGQGYGGALGVIVGFDINNNKLTGIGITTHSETKGLGSKLKDEPAFSGNFINRPISDKFSIKSNGGVIDAVSGATLSSKGACFAVREAVKLYNDVKSKIK